MMKKNAKRIFIPLFGIIMAMSAIFASFGSIAFAVDLGEEVSVEHVLTFGENATADSEYDTLKGWEGNYGADGYVVMSGTKKFYSNLYNGNDGVTEITESGMANNNNATSSTTDVDSPISSWGGAFQQWGNYDNSKNGYRNVSLSKPGTSDATFARYSTHSVNNRWDVSVYFTVKAATPVYVTLYVFDAERKVSVDAPMEILVYNSAVGGSRDKRVDGTPSDTHIGNLNEVYGGNVGSEPLARTFVSTVRNFVTFKLEGAGTYQFVAARSIDIVDNKEVAKGTPQPCIGGFFFDYDMEIPEEATFASSDVMTGTDWEGIYGTDGYIIFGVKDTSGNGSYSTTSQIAYTKNIYNTDGLVNFNPDTTKTAASSVGAYDFKITDDYEMTNGLVSRYGAQYNAWSWDASWEGLDYESDALNRISGQLKLPSSSLDGGGVDYIRGRMQPAGNNPTGVGSIAFTLTEAAFNGKDEIYVSIYHNAIAESNPNVGELSFNSAIYRMYDSQTTKGFPLNEIASGTASRYGNGSVYMTYCIQEPGDYTIYMDKITLPNGETTHRGTAQAIFFDYDAPDVPELAVTEFEYELGGGTNSPANPTSLTKINRKVTLTAPSREGYTFGGWFPNTDYTLLEKITTVSYDSSVAEKTLYAKWTPTSYTITYNNLEGATNSNPASYNIESATITLLALERTGYTFDGWFDNEELSGTATTQIVQGSTGEKNLYANWTVIPYTITYNNLEGAANSNPTSYNIETATITLLALERTGYTFGGWFDNAQLSGTATTQIVLGSTGDKTLYAKWTAISYNITFNANEGSGTMSAQGIPYNTSADIQANTFTRFGYNFNGWNTLADGKGTSYSDGAGLLMNTVGGIELFAQWTEKTDCTITFVPNNGGTVDAIENLTFNGTISGLTEPTKHGYTFGGWYSDGETSNEEKKVSNGGTVDFEALELTAKWIARNDVSVALIATDDTDYSGTKANITVGQPFGDLPTTPIFDDGSKLFSSWNTKSDGTGTAIHTNTIISADMVVDDGQGNLKLTLYAIWTDANNCKITFNTDGGSSVSDIEHLIFNGTLGDNVPLDPTKAGYTFGGWYKNGDFSSEANKVVLTSEMTIDFVLLELKAKWTPVSYSITYNNVEGATNSNPENYNIETATITLTNLERTGYTFGGWFDNVGLTGTAVTEITLGTTGNKTFYAKWTPVSYSITYNNVEGTTNSNPENYNIETATITLTNLERTGYTFGGWFDNVGLTGTAVTEITLGTTGNKTFYAKWIEDTPEPTTYTVTFKDKDGETIGTPQTIVEGEDAVPETAPTVSGYTFEGWYTTQTTGGEKITAFTSIQSNLTVYARYVADTPEPEPTVSDITYVYVVDGETVADFDITNNNPSSYTEGTGIATLSALSKAGYTFAGWFTDEACTNPFTGISIADTGDKTIYVKLTSNPRYTITYVYVVDGVVGEGIIVDNQNPDEYIEGIGVGLLADLIKEGYTFEGWFDETYETKYESISSETTGDITLYGKLTKKPDETDSKGCGATVNGFNVNNLIYIGLFMFIFVAVCFKKRQQSKG